MRGWTQALTGWDGVQISVPSDPPCPETPARDYDTLGMRVVPPGEMPKLGKGGTLASQRAIVHSLAHIESWAVDLAWDVIARFGRERSYALPRAFFDDWVQVLRRLVACKGWAGGRGLEADSGRVAAMASQVAEDEARHFSLLAGRLSAGGSSYGALPVHDGLWESAAKTAYSLAARLAVEHCVHEVRVVTFMGDGDPIDRLCGPYSHAPIHASAHTAAHPPHLSSQPSACTCACQLLCPLPHPSHGGR